MIHANFLSGPLRPFIFCWFYGYNKGNVLILDYKTEKLAWKFLSLLFFTDTINSFLEHFLVYFDMLALLKQRYIKSVIIIYFYIYFQFILIFIYRIYFFYLGYNLLLVERISANTCGHHILIKPVWKVIVYYAKKNLSTATSKKTRTKVVHKNVS